MEKPVLTKEQAEAINHWLNNYVGGKEALLQAHLNKGEWVDETAALNGMPFMTLASALINGYDIEKSPEERIKDYYFDLVYMNQEAERIRKKVVRDVLEILKQKIIGVNC